MADRLPDGRRPASWALRRLLRGPVGPSGEQIQSWAGVPPAVIEPAPGQTPKPYPAGPMSGAYSTYPEALEAARRYADWLDREVGIERVKHYGRCLFAVRLLPGPGHRFGHELRMEVVRPVTADPLRERVP